MTNRAYKLETTWATAPAARRTAPGAFGFARGLSLACPDSYWRYWRYC